MTRLERFRISFIGSAVTLTYLLAMVLTNLYAEGFVILFYYFPGLVFGIGVALAFRRTLRVKQGIFLVVSLGLAFIAVLYYASMNTDVLLQFRQPTFGGIGAIIALTIIRLVTGLKLRWYDIVIGFLIGCLTCYGIWTNEGRGQSAIITAIGAWQVSMFLILNYRQLSNEKTTRQHLL